MSEEINENNKSKVRKVAGTVSGVTPTVKVIKSAANIHSGVLSMTKGIIANSLGQISAVRKYEPSEKDGRKRFEDAVANQNLSDGDLEDRKKSYSKMSFIYFICLLLGTIYGAWAFSTSDKGLLMRLLVSFGFIIPLFFIFMHNLYMYVSIRDRNLYNVKQFYTGFLSILKKGAVIALVGIVLTSFSATGGAFAQELNIPETIPTVNDPGVVDGVSPRDDLLDGQQYIQKDRIFGQIMHIVFGDLSPITMGSDGVSAGAWVPGLKAALEVFTTTLLGLAIAILTLHTVVGTVMSAQEGQTLGQRWNTVFGPLRVTFGLGLLVPIGGISAAQLLVFQVVAIGNNLADEVWDTYVQVATEISAPDREQRDNEQAVLQQNITNKQDALQSMVGSINSDAMKNFALAFVEKQTCVLGVKEVYRKAYRDVVPAKEQSDSHFEALFSNTDADTKKLRKEVLKAVSGSATWFGNYSTENYKLSEGLKWNNILSGKVPAKIDNKSLDDVAKEAFTGTVNENSYLSREIELGYVTKFKEGDPENGVYEYDVQLASSYGPGGPSFTAPKIIWDYGVCGEISIEMSKAKHLLQKFEEIKSINQKSARAEAIRGETNLKMEVELSQEMAELLGEITIDIITNTEKVVETDILDISKMIVHSAGYGDKLLLTDGSGSGSDAGSRFGLENNTCDAGDLVFTEKQRQSIAYNTLFLTAGAGQPPLAGDYDWAKSCFNHNSGGVAKLVEAANKINSDVETSIKNRIASLEAKKSGEGYKIGSDVIKEFTNLGWASAGMYFAALQHIEKAKPTLSSFEPNVDVIDYRDVLDLPNDRYDLVLSARSSDTSLEVGVFQKLLDFIEAVDDKTVDQLEKYLADDVDTDGNFAKLNRWAGRQIFELADALEVQPQTAIQEMSAWGHFILEYIETLVGWLIAAGFLAGVIGSVFGGGVVSAVAGNGIMKVLLGGAKGSGGGLIVGFLGTIIKTFIFLILIAAAVHAYVFPWMPFLFHIMFVFSYLVLVATAILSAPVWAVWFVRLDDPELFGQQLKPGFMIMLNLLLRPALSIFGLLLAVSVFGGITFALNQLGKMSFLATIGPNTDVGALGATLYLVVITFLHYTLLMNSLGLISDTADTILLWVGDRTVTTAQDDKANTRAAVGVITNRIENDARQVGAGAIQGNAAVGAMTKQAPPTGGGRARGRGDQGPKTGNK